VVDLLTDATPVNESPFDDDPSVEAVDLPLWRESFAVLDWLCLRASPAYYGCGIPRGQGQPVLIVPGFMGDDVYLGELWQWLRRMGYRSYFSNIGRLADCPDHLRRRLTHTIQDAAETTGQPVRVIGHSMGGMLARAVAVERPDLVERVITMGSPIGEMVRAHPSVVEMTKLLRQRGIGPNLKPSCFSGHCTCKFVENMYLARDAAFKRYSIYSKRDAVVQWESCLDENPDLNFEVHCTHVGMAFDGRTYALLGDLLSRD
jgi:pimeloyl-ACP methyl ester carboxylesterase